MLTPKEQGNLVLAGKEGSIFYNLSIIEIFQNPFDKKKIIIINENNNLKNLGGFDDALLIYDASKFSIVYVVNWSVLGHLLVTVTRLICTLRSDLKGTL